MTLHSGDEGKGHLPFSVLPVNKPRHIVFTDEVIAKLGRIPSTSIIQIVLDTPDREEPHVTVVLLDRTTDQTHIFRGNGPTMGHAHRQMLDNVNEVFQLEDDDDPTPAA